MNVRRTYEELRSREKIIFCHTIELKLCSHGVRFAYIGRTKFFIDANISIKIIITMKLECGVDFSDFVIPEIETGQFLIVSE